MQGKIVNFRGMVTKRELVADIIFLAVSLVLSLLIIFIFDIHWSLYPGETLFPPSKYIGLSKNVYAVGTLIGTIVLFLIIKLFLIGVKEEEKNWKRK